MRSRLLIVLCLVGIPVLIGVFVASTRGPASAQLVSQFQQELVQAGVPNPSCSLGSSGKVILCEDKWGDTWHVPIYRGKVPPPNIPPFLQRKLSTVPAQGQ